MNSGFKLRQIQDDLSLIQFSLIDDDDDEDDDYVDGGGGGGDNDD